MHGPDGDEADGRGIAGTGKGRMGVQLETPTHPKRAAGFGPSGAASPLPQADVLGVVVGTVRTQQDGGAGIEGGRVDQGDRRRVFSPAEAQAVFHAVAEMFDARGGDDRNARSKQEVPGR